MKDQAEADEDTSLKNRALMAVGKISCAITTNYYWKGYNYIQYCAAKVIRNLTKDVTTTVLIFILQCYISYSINGTITCNFTAALCSVFIVCACLLYYILSILSWERFGNLQVKL